MNSEYLAFYYFMAIPTRIAPFTTSFKKKKIEFWEKNGVQLCEI
jgi:hypothetical protein